MAENFTMLRDKVRNWSNRDMEALPDAIIEDTMNWAADKAYRTLRVPPLEFITTYSGDAIQTENATSLYAGLSRIRIPGNLNEFIQLRAFDNTGATVRVFNEKADIRTFRDMYAEKYSDLAVFTREGNDLLLAPAFGTSGGSLGSSGVSNEVGFELYYYGRLDRLDSRYDVNVANYNAGLLEDAMGNPIAAPMTPATMTSEIPTGAVGQEIPNWLRDENERVVIYGALAECFSYLQEDDQAQKFMALFQREIAELNDEDVRRNASGGNVQINFNGRGLI